MGHGNDNMGTIYLHSDLLGRQRCVGRNISLRQNCFFSVQTPPFTISLALQQVM